jgi:hypothetical protein
MQVVSERAALSMRLKRGTETDGATTEEKKQTASQSFINAAADPGFHVVAAAQLLGPKLWVPLHAPEFLVGYTPNPPSDWLQTPDRLAKAFARRYAARRSCNLDLDGPVVASGGCEIKALI